MKKISLIIALSFTTLSWAFSQQSRKASVYDKMACFLKILTDSTIFDASPLVGGGNALLINRIVDSPLLSKYRDEAFVLADIIADYVVADSFKVYKVLEFNYANADTAIYYRSFFNRSIRKNFSGRNRWSTEEKISAFLNIIKHTAEVKYSPIGIEIPFVVLIPNWKTRFEDVSYHVQIYAEFIYSYVLRGHEKKYPNLIFHLSNTDGNLIFPLIFPVNKVGLGKMAIGQYTK